MAGGSDLLHPITGSPDSSGSLFPMFSLFALRLLLIAVVLANRLLLIFLFSLIANRLLLPFPP